MSEQHPADRSCLDLESIAAYVDGSLDAADRARVEEHLADCPRCYETFGETVRVGTLLDEEGVLPGRRQWPIRGVLAGLAAASLVVVAWSAWYQTGPDSQVERGIIAVADVSSSQRFTRGRVSGATRWSPAPSVTRGGDGPELALQAQEAAVSLQQLALAERSAATLRGAGIALLATGRLDDAIVALTDATEVAPDNASAHSDLASALIDRAAVRGEPLDASRALQHAERSLQLAPGQPAALFNRALAYESIGNRERAAGAWRDYLAADPDSRWAAEARERLAALEKTPAVPPSRPER